MIVVINEIAYLDFNGNVYLLFGNQFIIGKRFFSSF